MLAYRPHLPPEDGGPGLYPKPPWVHIRIGVARSRVVVTERVCERRAAYSSGIFLGELGGPPSMGLILMGIPVGSVLRPQEVGGRRAEAQVCPPGSR